MTLYPDIWCIIYANLDEKSLYAISMLNQEHQDMFLQWLKNGYSKNVIVLDTILPTYPCFRHKSLKIVSLHTPIFLHKKDKSFCKSGIKNICRNLTSLIRSDQVILHDCDNRLLRNIKCPNVCIDTIDMKYLRSDNEMNGFWLFLNKKIKNLTIIDNYLSFLCRTQCIKSLALLCTPDKYEKHEYTLEEYKKLKKVILVIDDEGGQVFDFPENLREIIIKYSKNTPVNYTGHLDLNLRMCEKKVKITFGDGIEGNTTLRHRNKSRSIWVSYILGQNKLYAKVHMAKNAKYKITDKYFYYSPPK